VPLSAPRWIERLLFLIAIVCLGTWLYAFLDTRIYEMREERRLDEAIRQRVSEQTGAAPASATDSLESFRSAEKKASEEDDFTGLDLNAASLKDLAEGDLIGRIKIPRVGVSAIVLHGIGKKTLRRGVGHIPGTPLPAHDGNVGLAGHRDSFFRGLKDIRQDDTIELTTLDGTFEYKVEWTKIVRPQDTGVLAEEGSPSLTLVTCYPFYYVGSAPKRFIVRAHRIDESEDASRQAG
jgi:LPXTG-site transpeptidase (sortase) family protein